MEPMDLSQLPTLDALLQESSVTGAARRVGLSTPAMSHALARLRVALGDPLLVRAGRTMVLTPRAQALRPRVHALMQEAQLALAPPLPFSPQTLERTFSVRVTDYVLTLLGLTLDRLLQHEAPGVDLRFVPNSPDDPALLREGESDLAVGIYGALPPELRSRQLLTDRLICVVRADHAAVGKRLTLDQFVRLPHIQVAPRARPGGYVDDMLAERGLQRRVVRAVPYFTTALQLAAQTDYVLTIPERVARLWAPQLRLRILDPPLALRPYALNLVWHPRFDADAGHRYLRDLFVAAARQTAGDVHAAPRRRLSSTDPTVGGRRRRGRGAR